MEILVKQNVLEDSVVTVMAAVFKAFSFFEKEKVLFV